MTYAQLVDDWRASTDRVAAEQGVEWPHAADDIVSRVAAYLKPAAASATRRCRDPAGLVGSGLGLVSKLGGRKTPVDEGIGGRGRWTACGSGWFRPIREAKRDRSRNWQRLVVAERDAVLQTYRRTDALLQQTQQDYRSRDHEYLAARAALEASFAEANALRREPGIGTSQP